MESMFVNSNSCKRSKVKPNFARLQRVDSSIVCINQATIVTSSDVPKGRLEREFPTISRVSRFAKVSQFDQMYDFSAFSHQHANVVTKDMAIHIKRSSKWYSHLTCTVVCVRSRIICDSWKAFLPNIDTVFFRCFDSLRVTLIPYWVPGRNKAMSIIRFDSLDHDRLDFLLLERVWKGGNSNEKPNFREPLRDCNQTFKIYCPIFLVSINQSFMLMRIYQASHWKSHVSSEGDKERTPKDSFKNRYRGYAFQFSTWHAKWCIILVWSMSMGWMFFVQKYH